MSRRLALLGFMAMLGGCGAERATSGESGEPPRRGAVGKADLGGSCASATGPACGGESKSGSCWCDTGCVAHGDCCDDAPAVCGIAGPSFDYDMLATSLDVDLAKKSARARIELSPKGASMVSLDVKGLEIEKVSGGTSHEVSQGRLDVKLASGRGSRELVVDYRFAEKHGFEGLLSGGATFVWPYFCGNLFPCKPDPKDGLTFTLDVHGAPTGQTVVFPKSIPSDAPPYMLAWATGSYQYKPLGTTAAGTKVGVYSLPGDEPLLGAATSSLTSSFEWLEENVGKYSFGSEVASVSVSWGPGAYGGMEHHPFWHVGRDSFGDESTHVHEAAHGWYGDGVRIACWEDFVLSEGTVSYLTARALGGAKGPAAEQKVWEGYETRLKKAVADRDHVAWPDSCNEVDILKELYTSVPYMKGAFFYRAVAAAVGVDKLDQVIAKFYAAHVGKAAGMADMLAAIQKDTGFDPKPLAKLWLRQKGIPPH